MPELDKLLSKINKLGRKLEVMVFQKGSLTDPDVVAVSQKLDLFIIRYQKTKLNLESCFNKCKHTG